MLDGICKDRLSFIFSDQHSKQFSINLIGYLFSSINDANIAFPLCSNPAVAVEFGRLS